MYYEIVRGPHSNEAPTILGRELRGFIPLRISEDLFSKHRAMLLRQYLAGNIGIYVVDQSRRPTRVDFRTACGLSSPKPTSEKAGDGSPPGPASQTDSADGEGSPPASGRS